MDFVNFTFTITAKYMSQFILQLFLSTWYFVWDCLHLLQVLLAFLYKSGLCAVVCARLLHAVRGDHGDIYHVPHLFPQVHHRLGTKSKWPITQNKVPIRIRGNNFIGYIQGQVRFALFPKLVKQFYFIFNSHKLIFSLIKWTKWDTCYLYHYDYYFCVCNGEIRQKFPLIYHLTYFCGDNQRQWTVPYHQDWRPHQRRHPPGWAGCCPAGLVHCTCTPRKQQKPSHIRRNYDSNDTCTLKQQKWWSVFYTNGIYM